MTPKSDFYETLQVSKNAEQAVIEAAYRKLALLYHPDVNRSPGATQKFQEINEAYEVLGNPKKRSDYDQGIREKPSQARDPQAAYESVPVYTDAASAVCPLCRLNDKTRLFAEVLVEKPHLGRRYALPAKPIPPKIQPPDAYRQNIANIKWMGGIITVVLSGGLILGALLFTKPSDYAQGVVFLVFFLLIAALLIGIKFILDGRKESSPGVIQRQKSRYAASAEAYQSVMDAYLSEMKKWERAKENWHRLYYCFREDVVFIPGKNKAASLNDIDEYINSD